MSIAITIAQFRHLKAYNYSKHIAKCCVFTKILDSPVAAAKITRILINESISFNVENNFLYHSVNFGEIFLNSESILCGQIWISITKKTKNGGVSDIIASKFKMAQAS